MTNCIFCCIFNNVKYVDLFLLLLESIFMYGNLDDNTHILVYTTTIFMNIIKQSNLYTNKKIIFEINDEYDNLDKNDIYNYEDKAYKARLDLFNLPSISNYIKILYLDVDILIKNDINKVFDICVDDILYVLEEGTIDHKSDCWGKTLFNNEHNKYANKTAFTSGILLFNNCVTIQNLFKNINKDILTRPIKFSCYDQPYIVYNAFTYNLYNNQLLKTFAINNDNNITSDKIIHHFPGHSYKDKLSYMTKFLIKLKNIKHIQLNVT